MIFLSNHKRRSVPLVKFHPFCFSWNLTNMSGLRSADLSEVKHTGEVGAPQQSSDCLLVGRIRVLLNQSERSLESILLYK